YIIFFFSSRRRHTRWPRDWSSDVCSSDLMAMCFNPLKDIVQASLSRYLYRQPYDYQRTVREASRRISTILELDSVLSFLADVIERTFKVEMVAVLLRDDARYSFTPQLLYRSPRWEY